jgi:hypothetical protein
LSSTSLVPSYEQFFLEKRLIPGWFLKWLGYPVRVYQLREDKDGPIWTDDPNIPVKFFQDETEAIRYLWDHGKNGRYSKIRVTR